MNIETYYYNIAYTYYLKYCKKNGYGIISFEYFIKNQDDFRGFYNEATIKLRNIKINKILKRGLKVNSKKKGLVESLTPEIS